MAAVSDSIVFIGQNITSIILLVFILHFTRNYLTSGVSAIPGPLLAKISNIWRFVDVAKGHAEVTLLKLHRKYGDYVRLGPNVVSVRDLDAVKIIYGINQGYKKVGGIVRFSCLTSKFSLPDRLLQSPAAIGQG
jgi:hypothetical protein